MSKKFAGNNRDKSIPGGWVSHEDTTCTVMCECGYEFNRMISDWEIERCPICGKGYKVEFVVWQYDEKES